ncbi:MAG: DUF4381 domain-containing protein [Colwellia sp.]|nr:DUF4381 domain-containing protein [Colwellia sp.]
MGALSQPLAQLKDIHLPDPVHNYPIALGWWLLLAGLLITLIILVIKWQKRRRLSKAKQLALKQLKSTNNADQIVTLMKWAAFQYFPRQEVASLHGKQLLEFFKQKLKDKHQENFQTLCAEQLNSKYQPIENIESCNTLKQAAQLWLSQALPPKPLKESTQNQQGVLQ